MSLSKEVNGDIRLERIFKVRGLRFRLVDIQTDSVSRYEESQARIGDLDPVFVRKYHASLREGAVFPPIVVWKNGDGYIAIDGNHRAEAYREAGIGLIQAYILDDVTDQEQAVYISGVINSMTNGKPVTDRKEIEKLVRSTMSVTPRPSPDQIGQEFGISRTTVRNLLLAFTAKDRLVALGVPERALLGISTKALSDLNSKITDDGVLKEAVELTGDAGMSGRDVTDLLRSVEKAGSEEARLAIIRQERANRTQDIAAKEAGTLRFPAEITRTVGALKSVVEKIPSPEDWVPLTPITRSELRAKLHDVTVFLAKVSEQIDDAVATDLQQSGIKPGWVV